MKLGMSDRLDVAETFCKFRCNPMSGRGRAGERSEPPLPFSSKSQSFFAYLLPFPVFYSSFKGGACEQSEPPLLTVAL